MERLVNRFAVWVVAEPWSQVLLAAGYLDGSVGFGRRACVHIPGRRRLPPAVNTINLPPVSRPFWETAIPPPPPPTRQSVEKPTARLSSWSKNDCKNHPTKVLLTGIRLGYYFG